VGWRSSMRAGLRSGSSCDYCLLLHDCISDSDTLPTSCSTWPSTCTIRFALLQSPSPLLAQPCVQSVQRPIAPLLVSTSSTFDDGDRASRSTLTSFAGNNSPTATATGISLGVLWLSEASYYTQLQHGFSYSSASPAPHSAGHKYLYKRWNA
jgi:hypothetical protein